MRTLFIDERSSWSVQKSKLYHLRNIDVTQAAYLRWNKCDALIDFVGPALVIWLNAIIHMGLASVFVCDEIDWL